MSTLFTLSGCLTYTFVIISSVILIRRLVRAFNNYETRSYKGLLFFELFSVLTIGVMIGVLFQNYGRFIA